MSTRHQRKRMADIVPFVKAKSVPDSDSANIPIQCRMQMFRNIVQRTLLDMGLRNRSPIRGLLLTKRHCQLRLE
ncbi:hypothetical protein TNCV_4454851 [Trichonephila clavipes]|nr:hypothetical protein TNCV_4454851 [Trichonephila clavipes]